MMKNNRNSEDNKMMRAVFGVALAGAFTLLLHGCNDEVADPASMEEPVVDARVPVEKLDAITKESVIVGGRLYDNLFIVSTTVPTVDNPMAVFMEGYSATPPGVPPYSDFIALSGADLPKQYRCKTCHGFGYLGSEFSDVGIMDAANNKTVEEIQAIISDGISFTIGTIPTTLHKYSDYLSSADIEKLATFIKYGVVDIGDYIYAFGPVGKGNAVNGKALYVGNAGCSGCHGATGKDKDFGGGEFVGTIGQKDPDEMLHKIRFGQPSAPRKGSSAISMPTIYDSGLTTQDAADIMTYTQQLPAL